MFFLPNEFPYGFLIIEKTFAHGMSIVRMAALNLSLDHYLRILYSLTRRKDFFLIAPFHLLHYQCNCYLYVCLLDKKGFLENLRVGVCCLIKKDVLSNLSCVLNLLRLNRICHNRRVITRRIVIRNVRFAFSLHSCMPARWRGRFKPSRSILGACGTCGYYMITEH